MDKDTVIRVEHVSKKYCKNLRDSMAYGVADIARNVMGLSSRPDMLRKNEFLAVDDVSFEVQKGQTLGFIGQNGSGKTTLLKMLNGIFWPDKGKIAIHGRVGALIAVGAGFHPLLTGRENIYLNAAILGMTKKEVKKKFDEIVDFADIGDFLDAPVKHYSSGMFVRLGFAIAVHCEPDILLVDEVLAVGDINFQRKCIEKILQFKKQGKAILLISHNLLQIEYVCDKCGFLNFGKLRHIGETKSVIAEYVNHMHEQKLLLKEKRAPDLANEFGTGEVVIKKVVLLNRNNEEIRKFLPNDEVCIELEYEAFKPIPKPNFVFIFCIHNDLRIIHLNSKVEGMSPQRIHGKGVLRCRIGKIPLLPNTYSLDVYIKDDEHGIIFDQRRGIADLIILTPTNVEIPYRASGDMGIVSVTGQWEYT